MEDTIGVNLDPNDTKEYLSKANLELYNTFDENESILHD